jgi:ABC-type sugar transport system ATPase subunit
MANNLEHRIKALLTKWEKKLDREIGLKMFYTAKHYEEAVTDMRQILDLPPREITVDELREEYQNDQKD